MEIFDHMSLNLDIFNCTIKIISPKATLDIIRQSEVIIISILHENVHVCGSVETEPLSKRPVK